LGVGFLALDGLQGDLGLERCLILLPHTDHCAIPPCGDIAGPFSTLLACPVFGVRLSHCVMQCTKCGETWDVNATPYYGIWEMQVFLPCGLGYRFFYTCPQGCNKAYRWLEHIPWLLTCDYQGAERD
jgi:hypothetical protein